MGQFSNTTKILKNLDSSTVINPSTSSINPLRVNLGDFCSLACASPFSIVFRLQLGIVVASLKLETLVPPVFLIIMLAVSSIGSVTRRVVLSSHRFASSGVGTTVHEHIIGFEKDNRTRNREKATEFNRDDARAVSKKLLKCRITKDFIKYAKQRGCDAVINSNHVKISKNGVTTGFQSPGRKEDLPSVVRKQKIEAFKAMGIAWDD